MVCFAVPNRRGGGIGGGLCCGTREWGAAQGHQENHRERLACVAPIDSGLQRCGGQCSSGCCSNQAGLIRYPRVVSTTQLTVASRHRRPVRSRTPFNPLVAHSSVNSPAGHSFGSVAHGSADWLRILHLRRADSLLLFGQRWSSGYQAEPRLAIGIPWCAIKSATETTARARRSA